MRVILKTSDIQKLVATGSSPWKDCKELKTETADGQYWSTGILERVIAAGHTVLAVSTRTELGDHDMWWLELVGSDNVCLAEKSSRNDSNGWMKAFAKLGIRWPTTADVRGHDPAKPKDHWSIEDWALYCAEPAHWTEAQPQLIKFDILNADAFR